ncbi:MAG TPA: type II secretion system protein [Verrucomicrobiae bacterium]|nr:type II secretion system protein [Verrucomicrobiae bacterium]
MKISLNRVQRAGPNPRSAFTLIEMIGVLAVIAILASMLIPRVFEAINSARVNSTAVACETVKTAAADHFGKYGQFDLTNGAGIYMPGAAVITNYDVAVLMEEGLLDKPFSARIAGADINPNSTVQLVRAASGNWGGPNPALGYSLDGSGNSSTTNASFVLEAVIRHVSQADAKDLNDRIDGTALGTPNGALGVADTSGRVEYGAPTAGSGTVDVYVYLTHR